MTTTAPRTAGGPAVASDSIARREILRFVAVQVLLSLALTIVALREGVDVLHIEDATALGQAATYGMALTPLVAALAARWSTARTPRGWGLRRVRPRTLALAWAVGLVPVLVSAAVVWLSGAGRFTGGALPGLLAATAFVVAYAPLALAEDLGWRGLLVPRLAQLARPRTVYLVSGLLWSLSHVGLIVLLGGTPEGVSPLYAAVTFTVATTALGAILAVMQLRWGMWPGVVAHATVNAMLYQFVEPATAATGPATPWIATETGLAYALAMVVTAVVFVRRFGPPATHQPPTSASADAS